jgi:SAM-dependent methyltransferase
MDSSAPKPSPPPGLRLEYSADLSLLPRHVPFLKLGFDRGAESYLERAQGLRHGRLLTWIHGILTGFLSDFDVNGLLGIYPMHVLSQMQWRAIWSAVEPERARGLTSPDEGVARPIFGSLLDIGAGSGDVTQELSPFFEKTTATETSGPMMRRLRKRGFHVVEGDLATQPPLGGTFDVVTLLNVLDRCESPLTLLSAARALVGPGGLLVIALVLPYEPVVLKNGASMSPRQRLPIVSTTFEGGASELITLALEPLGLRVELVSRVPYLSGGDAGSPLYELDDLIVVCRAHAAIPLIGARD